MATNMADVKAAMAIIKYRIKADMSIMTGDLEKDRVLWRSLVRKLGRVEKTWAKLENHFAHILLVGSEEETEEARGDHEEFQTELFALLSRVQDAIDKAKDEEEALMEADSRESRIRVLGERWLGTYRCIDAVLGELQTRLRGDPIDSLDVLELKST